MRLLIDECVDEKLRHLFPGHECQTARFARLSGISNGELLSAAEAGGFLMYLLRLTSVFRLNRTLRTDHRTADTVRADQSTP
jgi:hypothetical protein